MTHWMRSMHDAIMVGVGTAVNDDPRLNRKCPEFSISALDQVAVRSPI